MKEKAVETDITTRVYGTDTFNTTQDKVFLLSEADLFGTHSYNQKPTNLKDYTYNGKVIVPNAEMRKFTKAGICWLRSPSSLSSVTMIYDSGILNYNVPNFEYGIRPAMWIELP